MRVPTGLLLGLLALTAGEGLPGDEFQRARTPHFEVLTDAGAPLAREAAERLEELRLVLREPFPPRGERERRIVALLLASRARFDALVPPRQGRVDAVEGFFQGGDELDSVVARLSVEDGGPFAALDHEYAHLVLNRSLPAQPLWVSEGLAELLSDARFDAETVRLGAAQPRHEDELRAAPARLRALLAVGRDSPEYTGGGAASFYSRSWALARWIVARHGLAGLSGFLELVAAGADAEVAFESCFGPFAGAEATLLEVPRAALLELARPERPAGELQVQVDPAPPADVELRIGELLLQAGEATRARAHLQRALAAAADPLPARLALVELLHRSGEPEAARRELASVLDQARDAPLALLLDARLRLSEARAAGVALAPAVEERLAAGLERALRLAPDLYPAALLLAELKPEEDALVLAALQPAFDQDPGRTDVARTLAALLVKRRELDAARRVLLRARDASREPAYRFLCAHLLEQLEGYAAQTVEVRGRLVELVCRPDGSLRFSVATEDAVLWLEAPSARSFLVYGAGAARGEAELVCGAQDRPLRARYVREGPADGAGAPGGRNGSLVWVQFTEPARPPVRRPPPGAESRTRRPPPGPTRR